MKVDMLIAKSFFLAKQQIHFAEAILRKIRHLKLTRTTLLALEYEVDSICRNLEAETSLQKRFAEHVCHNVSDSSKVFSEFVEYLLERKHNDSAFTSGEFFFEENDLKRWINQGHIILLARLDNVIAGFIIIFIGDYPTQRSRKNVVDFLEHSAYLAKGYVTPQFRRRGIFTFLLIQGFMLLNLRTIKRATMITHKNNIAIIKSQKKLHAEFKYKLYYFRWLHWERIFLRRLSPKDNQYIREC